MCLCAGLAWRWTGRCWGGSSSRLAGSRAGCGLRAGAPGIPLGLASVHKSQTTSAEPAEWGWGLRLGRGMRMDWGTRYCSVVRALGYLLLTGFRSRWPLRGRGRDNNVQPGSSVHVPAPTLTAARCVVRVAAGPVRALPSPGGWPRARCLTTGAPPPRRYPRLAPAAAIAHQHSCGKIRHARHWTNNSRH